MQREFVAARITMRQRAVSRSLLYWYSTATEALHIPVFHYWQRGAVGERKKVENHALYLHYL